MSSLFYSVILILIGVIGLFKGHKVFKIFLSLNAFVIGFFFGWYLLATQETNVQIIGSLILGVLLGIVSYAIYKLGMFLIFMAISNELARLGIAYFNIDLGAFNDWAVIIFSILSGSLLLSLGIEKIILIVVTSLAGATLIFLGIFALINNAHPVQNINIFTDLIDIINKDVNYLITFLGLIFVGILVQFKSFKK